ncbi:hypothetical protein LIER_20100 [Lithospermum erythrorhizon]|uniref:Uncharacterized protein n=1 Tax=Lithospermum erythrorhizon TaxID=34254 RepID=A0AAV3QML0_LITER
MSCPLYNTKLEYPGGLEPTQPEVSSLSSCGSTPNSTIKEFYTDSTSSYVLAMMIGAITLEEQVACLTKVFEDLAKQVQCQDDSLSHIAGKIVDHEYRT